MIGVFVKFQYSDEFSVETIEKLANGAKQKFVGMPGLRSKAFTFDESAKVAVNFYIWESRDAAEAFFTPQVVEGVTRLYGVRPELQFVEIAAFVDNASEPLTAPLPSSVR